jgi:hypothetical protein
MDDNSLLSDVAQALAHFFDRHKENLWQGVVNALSEQESASVISQQVRDVAYEWCGYPGYAGCDLLLVNTLRDFGLEAHPALRRAILEYLFAFEPEKTLLLTHRLRAIDRLVDAKASVRTLLDYPLLGRGIAKSMIESALSILQDVDDLLNNP